MKKSLIIFTIFLLIVSSCWVDEIRKNKGVTTGKIIAKISCAKGGYTLRYQYTINNIKYINMYGIKIYECEYESVFKDRVFPVVYSTANPNTSIMLIDPEDFATWGYDFPDSLNWVRECFGGL